MLRPPPPLRRHSNRPALLAPWAAVLAGGLLLFGVAAPGCGDGDVTLAPGAACTPGGTECGPGKQCDASGQCVDAGAAAGTGGGLGLSTTTGTGGAGGGGSGCASVAIAFTPQIPTVVLLIDQSGSMNANFNGQLRWNAVRDALMDADTGVVTQLQSQVRFALALYSYSGNSKPAQPGTCPEMVEVGPPALDARDAIQAVYSQQSWKVHTPTAEAIDAVASDLMAFGEPGPKVIVLATDGEPDNCMDFDAHNAFSRQLSVSAAENAYAAGISTVIIAVGNEVTQGHQQEMANAGAGLDPDDPCDDPALCAPTYEPATKEAMVSAFEEIILGQRTCVFTLDGEVIAGKECEGTVTVNGEELPCGEGWQLNSADEIEFLDPFCQTILNDPDVVIEASFPCDALVNPPR